MTFNLDKFKIEIAENIDRIKQDSRIQSLILELITESDKYQYGYFWDWEGLPLIQMPEDIVLTQELILHEQPQYIIEAGIAWGGQTAMCASFLHLTGGQKIFGIDLVIPEHNRERILKCRNNALIELIEGDSTDVNIFNKVIEKIDMNSKKLVILDSNHTHEHVLKELKLWSTILGSGDFIIVSDTILKYIPEQKHRPRPWGPENNPGTAIEEFLKTNGRFSRDNIYNSRAIVSYNVNGYISCISGAKR